MTGKIALFGGTAEGRELSWRLAERRPVLAFVATGAGAELLERKDLPGLQVREGRLSREEMEAVLRREGVSAAVDATHPYAREASENLRAAAAAAGVPYLCLRREETPLPPDCLAAGTAEEAGKSDISITAPFTADENGDYAYTLPVSALDKEIDIAALSVRKKEWYGRKVKFISSTARRISGTGGEAERCPE